MPPLSAYDERRLAAVEAKVNTLQIELARMTTGMHIARWIAGVAIAALSIIVGMGR